MSLNLISQILIQFNNSLPLARRQTRDEKPTALTAPRFNHRFVRTGERWVSRAEPLTKPDADAATAGGERVNASLNADCLGVS